MSKDTVKRRRREKKTDYSQRLKLLKGGSPRLVVRKSSRNTVVQVVEWKEDGDEVVVQAEAKELGSFGWKGHAGNIPASYLAGYLLGKRAVENGTETCVFDLGLQDSTPGNRIYAAVKGAREAGLEVPAGGKMMPSDERVRGKHIEEYAESMDSKEKGKHFSSLMEKGLEPEDISKNFEEVKENIEEEG